MIEALGRMPAGLEAGWRGLGLWQDVSLADAMARAAHERPDAPLHFFGSGGEFVTSLGEVHAEGLRLAGSFHALGLRPGDTIAMQLPNSLSNAVLFQAAAMLGCTLLPIVHIYGPHELGHILADSGASALIVPDKWRNIDYLERLARLPELPVLKHRIVMGEGVPDDMIGLDTMLSVMEVFYQGFNDPKYRAAPLLKEMVAATAWPWWAHATAWRLVPPSASARPGKASSSPCSTSSRPHSPKPAAKSPAAATP